MADDDGAEDIGLPDVRGVWRDWFRLLQIKRRNSIAAERSFISPVAFSEAREIMKGVIEPDQGSAMRLEDSAIDRHRFDQSAAGPGAALDFSLSFMTAPLHDGTWLSRGGQAAARFPKASV